MATSGTQRQINITIPIIVGTTAPSSITYSYLPFSETAKLVRLECSSNTYALAGNYVYWSSPNDTGSTIYQVPSGKTLKIIVLAHSSHSVTQMPQGSGIILGCASGMGGTGYVQVDSPTGTVIYSTLSSTDYIVYYHPVLTYFAVPSLYYPFIRVYANSYLYNMYMLGVEE